MRLLTYNEDDTITIESFDDETAPPYAILSLTWGSDNEEVTFADIVNEDGRDKAGYEKIRFCGTQARRDGLRYFWVDTCCINKTEEAELAFSIRSMFRWYRNAARCYVYLSDVTNLTSAVKKDHHDFGWLAWMQLSPVFYSIFRWCFIIIVQLFVSQDPSRVPKHYNIPRDCQRHQREFSESRWFTRGWTLQELLAPSKVEFFTKEGIKLGDKLSLISDLSRITGIPRSALQGTPLSTFSVQERIEWSEHRKTTKPVDRAYSLMGILGISLSPIDGESQAEAMGRVEREVDKQNKCVQDLYASDPAYDKKRLEETKGGLLLGSYRWVLDNYTFQQWQEDAASQLLWVKGEPGKGKTMLLCGIIDQIQQTKRQTNTIAYFFCQATDLRINNAVAVLRGLLYMLVIQKPSLTSHIRKRYDPVGKQLFEDANAWVALSEVFVDMVRDKALNTAYLFVDALDECVADSHKLLDLIIHTTVTSPHVKWLVSGRNEAHIEQKLKSVSDEARLSLELKPNAEQVAQAVDEYIDHKLSSLMCLEKDSVRYQVHDELRKKANGTFLWVALVIQELEKHDCFDPVAAVKAAPAGLDQLYDRMLAQIQQNASSANICLALLCKITAVYRPLYLAEVGSLCALPGRTEMHRRIIASCGSFLTVRDEQVYLVHQSAKDYLSHKMQTMVLPSLDNVHYELFTQSLKLLSSALKRDVYTLEHPGISIDKVVAPSPDLLENVRYSCVYWVDHFCDSTRDLAANRNDYQTASAIEEFLRDKFLYWLETLSLCQGLDKGVIAMTRLWLKVQGLGAANNISRLVDDARRFVMYYKGIIEGYPLQAYASALLFSPTRSLVRHLFHHEKPRHIFIKPAMSESWTACQQTLEGHGSGVNSVAFSRDSTRLASASWDKTVKIWDAHNGACLQTLEGHGSGVNSVAFSRDSTRLASASWDKTVKIWDAHNGACLQTLEGHGSGVNSVAFSRDSTRLASASVDKTVKIWDAHSGTCLQTLEGHGNIVNSVAFSRDSTKLASASWDKTVKIWDAHSGTCLQTLEGHGGGVCSVAFSPNGFYIHTDRGNFRLDASIVATTSSTNLDHAHNISREIGLNDSWITQNGEKILWIPPEYRATCSTVSNNEIGIGTSSGKVWICNVGHS